MTKGGKKLQRRGTLASMGLDINELRRQFSELDVDESGTINAEELQPLLKRLGVPATEKITAKYMKDIGDSNGELDWFEFISFVISLGEGETSIEKKFTDAQLEQLHEVF